LIKLSAAVSDLFGVSGRAIMAALIAGERDPAVLASLARGSLRSKTARLTEALTGRFTEHHVFLLTQMLRRIDGITADVAAVQERIDAQIAPFAQAVARLDETPGVGPTAAHAILAEVGLDMTRFPDPDAPDLLGPLRARGQRVRRPQERQRRHRPRQPLPGPRPRRGHPAALPPRTRS
jgi:transposase